MKISMKILTWRKSNYVIVSKIVIIIIINNKANERKEMTTSVCIENEKKKY